MAPVIASSGQTRSRLPPKWMQQATLKASTAPTETAQPHGSEAAVPNHKQRMAPTLASDSYDTIRSRAESTTSTYVDTFAHRRKSRISDLTLFEHLDDASPAQLTPSESVASLNDLSTTLNDDDDNEDGHEPQVIAKDALSSHDMKPSAHNNDLFAHYDENLAEHTDEDDEQEDDDLTDRINRLMAATMEALEASNRLVLDTLSSRAKLSQLNAMEAALDSHLDAREANLHRQIQAVTDMTDFIAKTSAELQKLSSSTTQAVLIPPSAPSTSQTSALADPAELDVGSTSATGIVQALDKDATIGKTAAKRLERMLQTPSTTQSAPSPTAAMGHRRSGSSRRAFSISNFAAVQSSIAEEDQPDQNSTPSTPDMRSKEQSDGPSATSSATRSISSQTSTPQKKRSVSHDISSSSAAMKLLNKTAGTSRATSSAIPSGLATLTAASVTTSPAAGFGSESTLSTKSAGSRVASQPTMRPSLMATLRQGQSVASMQSSALVTSTSRDAPARAVSGLPTDRSSPSPKLPTDPSNASSTSAESTLAALLGMPSATASASSRAETPSQTSYFDSAMEDSISSSSPPTPGSIHGIHDVLSTPWKHPPRDNTDMPSSQERSAARRASFQYASVASPRASLSISDRDRAQQLSELRVERVTWNPQSTDGITETGLAATSAAEAGAGGGGGALRALQKLNEMSAAKLASHNGTPGDNGGKRVSLGLGLPSFSALMPSAGRSTSTPASASAEEAGGDVLTSSTVSGGWRSWTSWNANAAAANEGSTPQK